MSTIFPNHQTGDSMWTYCPTKNPVDIASKTSRTSFIFLSSSSIDDLTSSIRLSPLAKYSIDKRIPVAQAMFLNLCHGHPGEQFRSILHGVHCQVVESGQEACRCRGICHADLNAPVNTPRTDQGRVQQFRVVGGHAYDPAFAGHGAIQCVQQSRQSEAGEE